MEALILDLTLILVVAGAVTLLFKKLKQPLVLGYIVAGFLVSPHMPYIASVVDKENIQTWADIGVLFLLFALGLDFSFKKILKMGMAPVIAAVSIVFSMMTLGNLVGKAFGWSQMNCIFLGGMLAMSSTTIIYKAFDDMGLRQQRFASLVMSVLILEDILAIVMMVMLSTIAGTSSSPTEGGEMAGGMLSVGSGMLMSILRLGIILVLWFVVGIFLIPLFLRKTRRLMTDEMLVIISLGLCFLMAVVATRAGFSSAFGAFVMGSILAETIEADKIIRLVEPVKNLFGAVFFVSVGMLVDPQILVSQWLPIVVLTLTILLGQATFGSASYMLSGQPLKTAMRCGFSMAQIGEFAFIIASLGLSLGVISDFLYPVVVAVSVVTTFLTPYMIRAADPCYNLIEQRLPKRWLRRLNHLGEAHQQTTAERSLWHTLLLQLGLNTAIYSILSMAVTALMFTLVQPFMRRLLPDHVSIANLLTAVLAISCISPFLRAMVMKKNHSTEFRTLWTESHLNRLPLIFTVLVRIAIAAAFVFYIVNRLSHFRHALIVAIAIVAIVLMILSRSLQRRSIKLERLFVQNLRSREIEAQVSGRKRPLFEGHLLDRDIHIGDFPVPEDSTWAGRTLRDLAVGQRFGVHVSSILRGIQRMNIPTGDTVIFPGDRIQAIGNDEQLREFGNALRTELVPEDTEIEKREMHLRKIILNAESPFIGRSLRNSRLREDFGCMVVGVEEGQQDITIIDADRLFERGDIIWVVGEQDDLNRLNAG